MRIAYPYFGIFLAAAAALTVFLIAAGKRKKALLRMTVSDAMLARLVDERIWRRQTYKAILALAAFLFAVLALMGPELGMRLTEIKRRGIDVMIAVDCSKSMRAEDFFPNRLAKAKQSLSAFIDRLEGDRIGIVAFAGKAFLQCPLTLDYSAAKMFLSLIDTDVIPIGGTDIGGAIERAVKSFTQKERKYKVLILLTDGEDLQGSALAAASEAKKEGVVVYCVGIGKVEGEVIPVRDANGNLVDYQKDRSGAVITTKLDETTLQKIALETGGKYYHATAGEMEIDRILEDIGGMEKKELSSRMLNQYENRYQFFCAIAILLLLMNSFFPRTRGRFWRGGKRVKRGTHNMHRLLIRITLVMAGLLAAGYASPALAGVRGAVSEGRGYYTAGEYDQALERFKNAQIDDPESDVLHYNIGSALYKMGKYEEALLEFEKATYSKDINRQAHAYYDIGNTQYRLGKLPEAVQYYKKALELNPADEDAKYNIEFVQRKMKENLDKNKQPSSPQQQQQQQSQQQNQQQNQSGQQQQQSAQQQQGQQQQQAQERQAAAGKKEEDAKKDQKAEQEKKEEDAKKKEAERFIENYADEEHTAREQQKKVMSSQGASVEKDW